MSIMDKFLAVAGKIGSQKHMVAIRDAFATLIPILIAGSIALIINNFPIGFLGIKDASGAVYQGLRDVLPPWFVTFNGNIWWGTYAMFGLLLVPMLGYFLAKGYESDKPLSAAVISLSAFLVIQPQMSTDGTIWGVLNWGYLDARALFIGMIIAIAATEVFVRTSRISKLVIKMPDGVPPAVARSFASLIPGIIAIFSVAIVTLIIESIVGDNLFVIISNVITTPLRGLSNTLPAALLIVFLSHFLWIFGLHGPNILEGVIQTVYMPNITANAAAFEAGLRGSDIPNIVTKQFLDTFVYMGGSGATLPLLVAILILSKAKAMRTTATVSLPSGIFNINEPVVFGLPIVMNAVFAIPFVITPLLLTVISYGATAIGFVQRTVVVTHWTIPPILSGFLATGGDWKGSLLQIINFAIAFAIYVPFVFIANKAELAKEQKAQ